MRRKADLRATAAKWCIVRKADNSQTKPDKMVPKAVPKLVQKKANTLILPGILQVIGGLLVPRRGNLLHNLSI